jgi:transposase
MEAGATDEAGMRRRRVRSDVQKVKIVEALTKPGASVVEVSKRFGVHTSLLYRWRRQHERGLLTSGRRSARAARLIPVLVKESGSEQDAARAADVVRSPAGRIGISLAGGCQVQIHGAVEQMTLRAVLQELLRA